MEMLLPAATPRRGSRAPSVAALVSEAGACILLGVALAAVSLIQPLPAIPFIEREPAISFPVKPQTVSVIQLGALVSALPASVVLIAVGLRWAAAKSRPSIAAAALAAAAALVGLAEALLLNGAASDVLKFAVGKPRPNFFALCDYKGYAAATKTGDYAAYLNATVAGALGDASFCAGAAAAVRDAQSSFPSGHASFSWAGMAFLALFLCRAATAPRRQRWALATLLLAAPPLVLAGWVCATRVRDRWHDPEDVLCGAIIGSACAYAAFMHYVATGRADLMPEWPKDADFTGEEEPLDVPGAEIRVRT